MFRTFSASAETLGRAENVRHRDCHRELVIDRINDIFSPQSKHEVTR